MQDVIRGKAKEGYMLDVMRGAALIAVVTSLAGNGSAARAQEAAPAPTHERTLQVSGKWQNPVLVTDPAAAAKLKAHPVLKADLTVPPEADATWFQAKLAFNADGIARAEAPKWLLDRSPGTAGIDKATLSWDTTDVAAKLADHPAWFKIELVTQGAHARTIYVDNVRYEDATGAVVTEKSKAAVPTATLAMPYPDNEKEFPGKGPARKFPFMQGERDAFWKQREKDQGAIAFVGDSLTGGWKSLAKDFAGIKVANRGVGGDTSRNVVFRLKEDVLDLNPRAIVVEIGNNDLTAMGHPVDTLSNVADILALAEKARPGMPVVLCSIPPSANPQAPVKADDRKAINEGLRKLAADRPTRRFCDLSAAMAAEDGSPKAEYFCDDKLHMNDLGHSKWSELLKPILNEMNVR